MSDVSPIQKWGRIKVSTLRFTQLGTERHPALTWSAIAVYLFSIGMILGGIVLAPPNQPTRWFDEKQTLTSYSAALLYTASLVCFFNWLATRHLKSIGLSSVRENRFWAWGAGGFFVLMADEYFVMHEGIGRFITYRLLNLSHTDAVSKFDALVVGAYGVAGLILIVRERSDLRTIRWFFSFLTVGAVMATVSLFFDLGEDGVANLYIEDGTKILANASFLLACGAAAHSYYRKLVARLDSLDSSPSTM